MASPQLRLSSMKKRDLAKNARTLLLANPLSDDLNEQAKDKEGQRLVTEAFHPEEPVLSCIRRFALLSDEDFQYIYDNWVKFNDGKVFWGPVLNNYPHKPAAVMKLLRNFEKSSNTNGSLNKAIQSAPYEIVPMLKAYKSWDFELNEKANLTFFNGDVSDSYEGFLALITEWAQSTCTFRNLWKRKDSVETRRTTLKKSFQKWAAKKSNEEEANSGETSPRRSLEPETAEPQDDCSTSDIEAVTEELQDDSLNGDIEAVTEELQDDCSTSDIEAFTEARQDDNPADDSEAVTEELQDDSLNGDIEAVTEELHDDSSTGDTDAMTMKKIVSLTDPLHSLRKCFEDITDFEKSLDYDEDEEASGDRAQNARKRKRSDTSDEEQSSKRHPSEF